MNSEKALHWLGLFKHRSRSEVTDWPMQKPNVSLWLIQNAVLLRSGAPAPQGDEHGGPLRPEASLPRHQGTERPCWQKCGTCSWMKHTHNTRISVTPHHRDIASMALGDLAGNALDTSRMRRPRTSFLLSFSLHHEKSIPISKAL